MGGNPLKEGFDKDGLPEPVVGTRGSGVNGKALARGTEQKIFQENIDKFGWDGQANAQNPVGPSNGSIDKYMDAAGVKYDHKTR
ncbi:hypothetical protein [Aureivirga sp. CE67]|uniref:hypothetical protein n=1 Tax=Aureivirga sp. CE67 TaxID=1788983 RepID=UPI0018C9F9E0|nr:hypothetical protein [Aureivirga sp. CE67]